MLHLKLHTTSTTGHVVVTVISVGHWQFCRRVFATVLILLPSTLPLSLSYQAGWLCLRRWVAFGRSSHMQERKARACCSCNAHVLARRSNSMLSCKSLWLSPALSCSTLTPMTSCEHNFSRIFSTTTCCLRLRESLSKLSLFDVIATADTCQCNACASNDTCQCIAAVLVLVVAQPV